jgi:hypothetical protein
VREWVFEDVYKFIKFYMTHFRCSREHFNAEAMKEHYGDDEIVIPITNFTVIATKN